MGKKERLFPISTIGGRIYALRNKLGFHGDGGRIDFYDFLFSDVPGEKKFSKKLNEKTSTIGNAVRIVYLFRC